MPILTMPLVPLPGTSARPRSAIRPAPHYAPRHARVASLRRRLVRCLVLGLPLAVLVPAGVGAQAHPAPAPVLSVDFTHSVVPWSAERAAHPADCAASIQRFRDSSLVGKGVDTLLNSDADTLPTFVVQVARQCLRRFPLATITKIDLGDMKSILQLAEAPEADFDSLLARHFALFPPKSVRDRVPILFDFAYMASRYPRRLPLVRHFLAMIGAISDSDKVSIHGYVERLLYPDNVDTLWKYQNEQYAMAQRLDPSKMTGVPLNDSGDDWLRYLQTRADTDLTRYIDRIKRGAVNAFSGTFEAGWAQAGEPLPPLTPEFWFSLDPKSPLMTQPPVIPAPGALTLVVSINSRIDRAIAKRFQRFHEKYPQITLVFLTVTKGFYGNRPLPMTAQQEAEAVHDHFANFLRLPGYLGVSTTTFLKVSDGRLFPRVTQAEIDLETVRIDPLTIFLSTLLVNHEGRMMPGGMDALGLNRLIEIAQQAKNKKP